MGSFDLPSGWENSKIIDVLKESLAERSLEKEDPNLSAFRYVLLIDPTNVQSSIDLLFSLDILRIKGVLKDMPLKTL